MYYQHCKGGEGAVDNVLAAKQCVFNNLVSAMWKVHTFPKKSTYIISKIVAAACILVVVPQITFRSNYRFKVCVYLCKKFQEMTFQTDCYCQPNPCGYIKIFLLSRLSLLLSLIISYYLSLIPILIIALD